MDEEYKSVEKYLKRKKRREEKKERKKLSSSFRSYLISFCNRVMICGILVLSLLCIIKMNPESKKLISKHLFETNFSFAKIQDVYQKYFGRLFPQDVSKNLTGDKMVFQESFLYQKKEDYQEGTRFTVGRGYLMPALESGLVVFSGEKEGYGETLIIQQVDGVDTWYVGLSPAGLALYDYVEKGSLLGEVKEDTVDLYFQKDGAFVKNQNYIS